MNLSDVLHVCSKSTFTRVFLIILAVLFVSFNVPTTNAFAAQATLAWNPPTNPDGTLVTNVNGYKVYYGTAAGNYSQNINVGNVTSYDVANLADATTYYFAVTDYTTTGTESGFSNQASYTTPTPPPSSALYTLTASAGSGGSISPSGSVVISQGASQTYTITPNTGYYVVSVVADGTTVASNIPLGGYTYTFSNVTANHTISATFAIRNFEIKASAGSGGSVSPTDVWVLYNTSQTVSITPSSGYKIANVQVDGTSVGAVSSYTFNNIAANHTVAATFTTNTIASFNITASAGTGGSISPAGTATVNTGGSQTYTITPSTGYYVVSVVVDGTTVASNIPVGGYTYTFSNVTANHTISATFAIRNFEIKASAGSGGSVSPTDVWVLYNTSQTVSITPSSGYKIANVQVDGTSVGAVSSYTFNNIAANHTVAATFTTITTITASAGTGGGISPAGTTTVNTGGSQTYTITPATGYKIGGVTVDGAAVGVVSSYTFSNVTANHNIAVTFATKNGK